MATKSPGSTTPEPKKPRDDKRAARRAAKSARRSGGKGRIAQIREVYRLTKGVDPNTPWILLLCFLVPVVVAVAIAFLLGYPFYGLFVGLPLGLLVAMFVFARKAETAAYSQIEGQQGAAVAAMRSIRRGWNVHEEPVAMDPRSGALIFRATGRPGIALVAEAPNHTSARKLLDKEKRKVERLLPNVPVHSMIVGRGKDEVPLTAVVKTMGKYPKSLTAQEAAAVQKRLSALPSPVRSAMPKGVDPFRARPDRKALRGR